VNLSEENQTEQSSNGDSPNKRPLTSARPGDTSAGAPHPVTGSEAGGVHQVTENMDGHGPEPQDEAGLVQQEEHRSTRRLHQ
jgi:hypothetical protein